MAASAFTTTPAPALGFLGDERLARLASRGDRRAFSALYERHLPALTRYCSTILRNGADAEDAAQNAMVSSLRALEAGTVPMRVRPWLYRIAHNEALAVARRRRAGGDLVELDEATLPAVGGAEEASEIRARLAQLMSDLRALTERQRQALVLRELYDFTYEEIAQTLACSAAAAQQTVFEARSALTQFGEGRALACEGVQRALSECDGMRLRARTVRAHLRDCECCRGFEQALRARRRDLGLLFPQAGGATGLAGVLAKLFADRLEPLLAAPAAKAIAVGVAVVAGAGGTVAATHPAEAIRIFPAMRGQSGSLASAGGLALAPSGAARPGRKAARGGAGARRSPAAGAETQAPADDGTRGEAPGAGTATGAGTHGGAGGEAGSGGAGGVTGAGGETGAGSTTHHATAPVPAATGTIRHGAGDAVGQTVAGVQGTAQQATGAVEQTVTTATGAVGDVVGDATGTLQQAGQAAGGAVQQTTTTATGAVSKVLGG